MASFKYLDMNKIDPGWARKHRMTLWASGVSPYKVEKICAKPSFSEMAASAEKEYAIDEALAKAKEEGAKEALQKAAAENKAAQKNNSAKPSALKDTTVSFATAPANNNAGTAKDADSEEKKAGSGKPSFTFSAEEDKLLLELKNENKSWKDIAKQLKKPQDAVKNRFKEIGSDDQKTVPQKESKESKKESKKEAKESKKESKESKKESKKANRDKTNGNSATQPELPNREADQSEDWDLQTITEADEEDYLILYPDSVFDEDALVAMARAMYEDHENYYQRIVSRIYDATGQRISMSAVKRKVAEARNQRRGHHETGN
ncbi:uncharacterized protein BKCO1_2000025 [Diplodia corticola]|uniref:Myb-like domain-containing protein n=1 Tax=Diplodia corticola TaxID=236234 RepID=A0A1J9R2S2_9PEZI|nr:uncharacterized protein BKCO1_2000025 [Diplodia corticola]OJD34912.1 hypothetical protein BKCO1_2000025 [Diplodia corticola]